VKSYLIHKSQIPILRHSMRSFANDGPNFLKYQSQDFSKLGRNSEC